MQYDLHPAVVHFPIAWLVLATLLCAADAIRSRLGGGLTEGLLLLALLTGLAATWSGDQALQAQRLVGEAGRVVKDHLQAGNLVPWLTAAVLALRLWARLEGRPRAARGAGPAASGSGEARAEDLGARPPTRARVALWGAFLLSLLASIVVLRAGYLGGLLVHEHGVISKTSVPVAPDDKPDVYRSADPD